MLSKKRKSVDDVQLTTAQKIVKKLMSKPRSFEEAFTIEELNARGITGELLDEVYNIFDKSNCVVDTHIPHYASRIAEQNMRECKHILAHADEPPASVYAELSMLQRPKLALGLRYIPESQHCMKESDTGRWIAVRKLETGSRACWEVIENTKDQLFTDGEDLISLDKSSFSHKNLN